MPKQTTAVQARLGIEAFRRSIALQDLVPVERLETGEHSDRFDFIFRAMRSFQARCLATETLATSYLSFTGGC